MNLGPLLKKILIGMALLSLTTAACAYTAADYTNAGLQFYAAKNYVQAVPYFTAALGMDPSDKRALQGRANSYYFSGKYQEALADYEKLLAVNPSGPVSQFVQALSAKMGSAAPAAAAGVSLSGPGSSGGAPAGVSSPQKPAGLGFRLVPALGLINLKEFTADSETGKKDAAVIQQSDSSYQYNSTQPTDYVMVGAEPVMQVGSSFEIGLPFTIMPVGTVSSTATDAAGDNYSASYALNAFSVGLTGRLLFGQGPVRIFVAAGGLLAPVGINYTNLVSVGNSTITGTGNFSQTAFGGQGQLGLDFHVGEPFVVSVFGGYQALTAEGFKGSITTSGNGPTATDQGQLGVFDSPNGEKIAFLKDGDPAPLHFRALQVDLTGIMIGIHLAVFF